MKTKLKLCKLIVLVMIISSVPLLIGNAVSTGGWVRFYNGTKNSGLKISKNQTRAQKFTATDFSALSVYCPSFGNNTGSLTLTLYCWNENYTKTVAGQKISANSFQDFKDNSWLTITFPSQSSGSYLWVLSNPTETVGIWAQSDSTNASLSYLNGSTVSYDYLAKVYQDDAPLKATVVSTAFNTTITSGSQAEYWAYCSRDGSGNNEDVIYLFDWGDGTQSMSTYAPALQSNQRGRVVHTYSTAGTYSVKAKAIDRYGAASPDWSDKITVTVTGTDQNIKKLLPVSISASTSFSSETSASNVIDGNLESYWSSEGSHVFTYSTQWLAIDLGSIKTVNRMKVYPRQNGYCFPVAFTVQYSLNGQSWFDLPARSYTCYLNPGSTPQLMETGGISARYMRIYSDRFSKDDYANYYFQLSEIEVYGQEQGQFFTSAGGEFDAAINNLWKIYGTADNESTPSGYNWANNDDGGIVGFGSTEWFEWDSIKLSWTGDLSDKEVLKSYLYGVPMDSDGFIWATNQSRLHLDIQKHSTNNASLILAAYDYYMWNRDSSFLTSVLPSLSVPYPDGINTMLDKLRKALDWYLAAYNGKNGIFIYKDTGYEGLPGTYSSTYWDAFPTGYKDAYTNVLMYRAVKAMAALECSLGNNANATLYESYLPTIRQCFNNTFWNEANGRYTQIVDVNGVSRDYGFTELNFMAVAAGLADSRQAKLIYDWVDGNRIVSGDTSTGSDIYAFAFAARTNTLDIASSQPYWWVDDYFGTDPSPTGNCYYGGNVQNGGAIFYTSYDDILGRMKSIGADSAYARFSAILNEYAKDELRRHDTNALGYNDVIQGIMDCFPESGLVPLVLKNGFLGISATSDGLHISPSLPSALTFAGINELHFGSDVYKITASRAVSNTVISKTSSNSYEVTVPNGQETVIDNGAVVSAEKRSSILNVSVSGSMVTGGLSALADGDSSTGWSSEAFASSNNLISLTADLGARSFIRQIGLTPLQNGKGFPSDFKIQYSLDGQQWINAFILQEYSVTNGTRQTFMPSSPICARYVRISASGLTENTSGQYFLGLSGIHIQ